MPQTMASDISYRNTITGTTVLDYWLKTAGSIPLLTPSEELHLSHVIRRGQRHEATAAEKRAARRAIERMIKGNMRLVVKIAKSFQFRTTRTYLGLEDLLQEGCIGLHRAAQKFNPEAGCKFSTYAYWWIRERIGTTIEENTGCAKMPRRIIQELNKNEYKKQENPPKEASKASAMTYLHLRPISLDSPLSESSNLLLIDTIKSDEWQSVYESIDINNAITSVKKATADFELVQEWAIRDKSLSHLASENGISRQAMANRIKRGCKRLAAAGAEYENLVAE